MAKHYVVCENMCLEEAYSKKEIDKNSPRMTKLAGGGNYKKGSYCTLSENPKNFDFLIVMIGSGNASGSPFQQNSIVIPSDEINYVTDTSQNDYVNNKGFAVSLFQGTNVYVSATLSFYNIGSTYRLYLYTESVSGWGSFYQRAVYGVKL